MSDSPTLTRHPDETDRAFLERVATACLPHDVATRWLRLLRPAAHLVPAGPDDVVVARLGGLARVPDGFEWPSWEGHGALSYLAEIDLGALHASGVEFDVVLPRYGRLLFFYFDGSLDGGAELVMAGEGTLDGMRVVHLDSPDEDTERQRPNGHYDYPLQLLTAVGMTTVPDSDHPAVRHAFDALELPWSAWQSHPLNGDAFREALWSLQPETRHQIGGWPCAVQGPVEMEVSDVPLDWTLLLQLDSDNISEMMWGDVGTLYWLTRTKTASAKDLGEISFTWQCG